ncbi:hypothetical protein ABS767_11070 [Sphingomonas sp. ST-64]|uniref:Uncharacterized protein n=1 Tax=Sphingomonas plantiphila TaxID=3163295 RepID=A0ABW8YMJ0_9SPHN
MKRPVRGPLPLAKSRHNHLKTGGLMGWDMVAVLGAALIAMPGVQDGESRSDTPSAPETIPADAPSLPLRIAAQTLVIVEIAEPLSSRSAVVGQRFAITLAEPIVDAGGQVVIRAGTTGEGEVIHARKAGFAGKAGELIVAARFLRCGATEIPLGRFKFGLAGDDHSKAVGVASSAVAGASVVAPVAGVASVVAFVIKGGQIEVPVGARGNARLKADLEMTKEAVAECGTAVVKQGEL